MFSGVWSPDKKSGFALNETKCAELNKIDRAYENTISQRKPNAKIKKQEVYS
jgi:hypothetical protein